MPWIGLLETHSAVLLTQTNPYAPDLTLPASPASPLSASSPALAVGLRRQAYLPRVAHRGHNVRWLQLRNRCAPFKSIRREGENGP